MIKYLYYKMYKDCSFREYLSIKKSFKEALKGHTVGPMNAEEAIEYLNDLDKDI